MMDPRRLLDEGASAAERSLLEAAAFEEPPPDGANRLRAALGLSVGALATGAATAAAAAAPAGPAAAGSAAKLGGAKVVALWVTAASTVVVVGATLLAPRTPAPVERRTPRAQVAAAPVDEEPAAELPVGAGAATDAVPAVDAPAPDARPHARAARSIAQETARLDEARRALRAHESARALAALDRYERENRSGVLAQEASMLRIEVLAAAGQVERARRLGTRFLRAHPTSPHAARVRALLDGLRAE